MRSRRRFGRALTAFTAGVGGLALAAGAAAGASPPKPASDSGQHQVVVKTEYACTSGEGKTVQKLPAEITATVPTTIGAGEPVKLGDLALSFALARDAVPTTPPPTGTSGEPSTVVTARGSATIDIGATMTGKRGTTPVKLSIGDTAVNSAGDTAFTARGSATITTGAATGAISLDLGAPVITIGSGTAEATFTCTADHPAALTSVLVRTTDGKLPESPKPPAGKQNPGPGTIAQALGDPRYLYIGLEPLKVNGYSTVKKAKTRLNIETVMVNGVLGQPLELGLPLTENGDVLFPTLKANLLGFDFVPTSADVELLPVDFAGDNKMVPISVILREKDVTAHLENFVRIKNVKVNGVPLDVGPDCRTATPASIDLMSTQWDAVEEASSTRTRRPRTPSTAGSPSRSSPAAAGPNRSAR